MVHFQGTGEGVLWRVVKVDGQWIRIEPMFTVTGPSVLKPKRVAWHEVKPAQIVDLGAAYVELQHIMQDLVRLRSQDPEPEAPPEPECTCPDWWFPPDRRERLRKLPHNYCGVLAHHESCAKYRED